MGKLGARLKVVRPRHPNSCDLERANFRTGLARQMFTESKERSLHRNNRPVRIWVSDEARFGLQLSLRRAWVSRGIKVQQSSDRRYDWQYLWAATFWLEKVWNSPERILSLIGEGWMRKQANA